MFHVLHLWVLCRNLLALCDELVYILIRSKLFPVMYLLFLKKACPHMGQCIYFTATQYKVTTDSILVRRAVRNLVCSFELLHCCRNIVNYTAHPNLNFIHTNWNITGSTVIVFTWWKLETKRDKAFIPRGSTIRSKMLMLLFSSRETENLPGLHVSFKTGFCTFLKKKPSLSFKEGFETETTLKSYFWK